MSKSHRWFGLTFLALGVSMIIVDATVVNVALPTIIRDLGIELADAEWVNTIYVIMFAALLITAGRVGDVIGRRTTFHIGVGIFLTASMLAGLAHSGSWLIGARFLQGIGGAMVLPTSLSIVNATFVGRERGIAFGVWGSVIGGMAALGPLIGGWLTTSHSWRWVFYINVPIGVLVVLGTIKWVVDTKDDRAVKMFDIRGVLLLGFGLASLVFGLIEGQRYGWLTPIRPFALGTWVWPLDSLSPVPLAFALAAVLLAVFVFTEVVEYRRGEQGLIDISLFEYRSFRYGNVVALTRTFGEFGLVFVLPLFLSATLGYSAFRIGLVLLPLAAGAFIGGPLAAALSAKIGANRTVSIGMGLEAASVAVAGLQLSPAMSGWHLAPALAVYGVGVGIAAAQLSNVILVEVPRRASGQASGMQSTARQIGSAFGIALLGTILAVSLSTLAQDRLAEVPGLPSQAIEGIAGGFRDSAGQLLIELRDRPDAQPVVPILEEVLTDSARRSALTGAAFIALGFLISFKLPDTRHVESRD